MSQITKTSYEYEYISTGTTTEVVTQVATGQGVLHSIVIGETAAAPIVVVDGTSGTTANLATLKSLIAEGDYIFDANFKTGLRIVTTGASKFTVVYTKN